MGTVNTLSFGVSDIQCLGTRGRQRHRQVQGINRVGSLQDLRQSDFQKSEAAVLSNSKFAKNCNL